jgi:hypothetical protein
VTASTAGDASTALVCLGASVVAPLALLCALTPREAATALDAAAASVALRPLASALAWAARTLRGLA